MTEWIKVEDKLPPQNTFVLIAKFDYRPKVEMYFIEIAYRLGKSWFREEAEITSNGKYGKITHWMPLPDAPK